MAQSIPPRSSPALLSSNRLLAAVVFVATAALYVRTAGPTLGGAFDSEEFQYVAYTLGIAHATGYPLYLILGKLFTTLVPIGSVAYRMNLLSAFIGAGAVVLVYLNTWELTGRRIASLAAAALFATNPAVWRQAGVASVGPLHLLLVAAILYVLLLWPSGRAPLSLAAFLFGLSLTHHRTTLLLVPATLVLILLTDPGVFRRSRELLRDAFWLVLPLLLYLYIPLFGNTSPWYITTLQGLLGEISGGDAGAFVRASPADVLQGIALVSQYLSNSFGYAGAMLITIGAVSQLPRRARPAVLPLFLGLCTLAFSIWGTLYAGEPDRYLVLPFTFLIYWFGLGASTVQSVISRIRWPRLIQVALPATQVAFVLLLALFLILPFGDRLSASDWSTFDRVYKQWDEIFTLPLPRNAILVGNWGQLNAMRYMQRVEHRRPDLELVGTLYDPTPQTVAAENAFATGRALFLAPGISQPPGTYHYATLGPLLEVRNAPEKQRPGQLRLAPDTPLTRALILAGWYVYAALEPHVWIDGALSPQDSIWSIAPGRTMRATLYWKAGDGAQAFLVRLGLFDSEGRLVSQRDEPPVRGLEPASQWQSGEYLTDVHNFLIPPGSPPGRYDLRLQVIDASKKTPLGTGEWFPLAAFDITRITDLSREQVFVQHPLDLNLNSHVALWGFGGLDGAHRAGEPFSVNLLWAAREMAGTDFTVKMALVGAKGETVQEWTREPLAFYPPSEWQAGELLKAYYDLTLAPDLPPGDYAFSVGFDQSAPVTIASIQIAR